MSLFEVTKVNVQVRADLATETFVIDHALRLVTRGVGNFTYPLAPGLYKFKFRSGQAVNETYYEISAGASQPVKIDAPALAFDSAAPLRQTRYGSSDQLALAESISSGPALSLGHGSWLFIFVREDLRAETPSAGSQLLTLHALDGTKLANITQSTAAPQTPGVGALLELDSAAYRLRAKCEDEVLEQIVVTSAGWQTQVFLAGSRSNEALGNILANNSVLMSRGPFRAEDAALRYADAARIALSRRSILMPSELLNYLLDEKFDNPMLGIYAGHALQSADDVSVLQRLVPILEQLVPGHPDVLALSLRLSATPRFDTPPMLRRSWTAIIKATLEGKAQLPPGSLASRIPSTLLGDTPWLIWPESALLPLIQSTAATDSQLDQLQELFSQIGQPELRDQLSLNQSEEALYTYLTRRAQVKRNLRPTQIMRSPQQPSQVIDQAGLARTFGTTVPNVQATVEGLAAKLSNVTGKPIL